MKMIHVNDPLIGLDHRSFQLRSDSADVIPTIGQTLLLSDIQGRGQYEVEVINPVHWGFRCFNRGPEEGYSFADYYPLTTKPLFIIVGGEWVALVGIGKIRRVINAGYGDFASGDLVALQVSAYPTDDTRIDINHLIYSKGNKTERILEYEIWPNLPIYFPVEQPDWALLRKDERDEAFIKDLIEKMGPKALQGLSALLDENSVSITNVAYIAEGKLIEEGKL